MALVITIIVLLILAGVSINFIFGADGIFTKSQYAVEKYQNAQEEEQKIINSVNNSISEDYILGNRDTFIQKKLLPVTNITLGEEYTLNDSIYNYDFVKIYVGVFWPDSSSMWNSVEIPVETIFLDNEESSDGLSEYSCWIASSVNSYRVPHFRFTQNNKIHFHSLKGNGWTNVGDNDFKLIVYGYKKNA